MARNPLDTWGTKYEDKTQGEKDQDERIRENLADLDFEDMSFEEFEDMFEDRDPTEFL